MISFKKIFHKHSVSDMLPYIAFSQKDSTYHLNDGYDGFIFECTPLLMAGTDTENILKTIIGSLPAGSIFQVRLFTSKYIKGHTRKLVEMRNAEYQELAKSRKKFIDDATANFISKTNSMLVRNFRLVISCKIPSNLNATEVKRLYKSVEQNLSSMGVFPRLVGPQELIEYLSEHFNHQFSDAEMRFQYNDNEPIKNQIIRKDIVTQIEQDYIKFGDIYASTLSLTQLPPEWNITNMINMTGDNFLDNRMFPFNFAITHTIFTPDKDKENKKFQIKYANINYQCSSTITRFIPRLGLKKEDYDNVSHELENGDQLVKHYTNFTIFANSRDTLFSNLATIQSYFSTIGIGIEQDKYVTLPAFISALPLCYNSETDNYLKRTETTTRKSAVTFCPVVSDWAGTGTPTLTYFSRKGQLVSIDLFDSPAGYSGCVAASTGGGKSFFINDIILNYISCGAKIWVIDIGRSYLKLNQLLGGQFIEFSDESSICVNPFTKIKNIENDMDMLRLLFGAMSSPEKPLENLDLSFLEEGIRWAFSQNEQKTTVTHVYEFMKDHNDRRYNDIARTLYPYTKNGAYGQYFEGDNNISFDKDFICLELEELKQKSGNLLSVILLMMIYEIQQGMYLADRDRPKFCIIDEAWDLLAKPNTGPFMEAGYRKFRKYNGGAITIYQGLQDLSTSESGRVIFANSDWVFMLRQKPETINYIRDNKMLAMNNYQLAQLASIKTEPGKFSEVYVHSSSGSGIIRHIVNRFTQLIYTTHPGELKWIKHIKARDNLTTMQAIQKIVEIEEKQGKLISKMDINEYYKAQDHAA